MGIKYKVNYNFFKTWSKQMAYVLGCLYSDGSLENSPYIRGKYVRFSSTEYDFVKNIRRLMGSEHTITKFEAYDNRKEIYRLRIGSHSLYNDLEALVLFPNKSLTIGFPEVPASYLADFIRGYLDGDGSVIIEKYKKDSDNRRLKAIFTSGSKRFLESLDKYLQDYCCIDGPNLYNSHNSYQLVYRSWKAKKVLEFIYKNVKVPLYLKRKYFTYKKAIKELKFKHQGDVPK